VTVSKQAKYRLRIIAYYRGGRSVNVTCRHFGIGRIYFYEWYGRFNPHDLSSLEDRSRRPRRVRQATYDTAVISIVRKLRQGYPAYSAKKLAVIIRRDYGLCYSAATIGRIIQRFRLYFSAKIKASKQRAARAKQIWKRRKPYGLTTTRPRRLIEFDMKHIYLGGVKQYALVAIDVLTKETVIHLANRPRSYQAKLALSKAFAVFGRHAAIVTDNGSENCGQAYDYLRARGITHYFARPHQPKDKSHVENVIGKLQQECLDESGHHMTLAERDIRITAWLNDYHYFRPHQALGYQTPAEYCATLGLTIHRRKVSTM
jgi:transposase InsO family protein